MGRGRGGKHWRIATVLRINAPCRYHSGITGSQTLEVSIFTLFSSLFIARRIPPSIPPGLKPLLRGVGAQSDPCPCPAAGKSQIPRTPHSAVAAAAKSLQSCPTLCDPIDGSPPGPPFLGFSRQEHVVSIQPHNNPQWPGWPGPHFTRGRRKIRKPKFEGGLPNPGPSSLHQTIPPVIFILKWMNNYGSQHSRRREAILLGSAYICQLSLWLKMWVLIEWEKIYVIEIFRVNRQKKNSWNR